MTRNATITGVGSALPPRVVPNSWFEGILDTSDEWIRDRTGIESRHFADDGTVTSDLALEAGRAALASAGVSAEQVDLIVVATTTGDMPFPSTAVWTQRKLGVTCPAFDVQAACAGFSYGLSTATAFVTSGMADTVLLIGAEVFSRILNFTDRGTSILFGDGAGAAVIQAADQPGIIGTTLGADGTAAEILWVPGGGSLEPASHETVDAGRHNIAMPNGREVFKRAVTEMAAACRELLDKSGFTPEDVDLLIPHQANARIMAAVAERLHVPPDRAVIDVAEVGNTSAASIPIALDRAWRAGRIHEGDLVLFTSFGAGLTWGASLVRWTMAGPRMTGSRVAVVTGASRGIGLACSVALAEAGWRVAIGYRSNEAAAKEAVSALEAAGTPGLAVFLDITDEAAVHEAFRRVTDELGPVTGLINNAGLSQDGLLLKYNMETFDRVMDTNVRGAFLCAKAAMRGMLKERWGRMVNMSSAVALRGNAGQTVYAATKTALVGLTKSLAREVGAKGITVNAVCPGLVDTEMTSHLTDAARAYYVDQTPLGRTATLQEVAGVVRFLMSDEASYVNGAVIPVDGGLTA